MRQHYTKAERCAMTGCTSAKTNGTLCDYHATEQPAPNLALWRIHPTWAPTDELEDVMRAWREECRRDEDDADER